MIKSLLLLLLMPLAVLADSGADVLVIFNSRSVDSRDVASYYAQRRAVPTNQVWAFEMSTAEAITRAEYLQTIQNPILKKLEESKLWSWHSETNGVRRLASSKIKYLVL